MNRRPRHLRAIPSSPVAPAVELVLGGEPLQLVPERQFSVTFVRAERRWHFQRLNVWLWFRVLALDPADAPYDGIDLPLVCATKEGRLGQLSKFARLWARVAGRRPLKGERLSTGILAGKLFTIRTRTVRTDHEQRPHGALGEYSVIADVSSIDVGGPA